MNQDDHMSPRQYRGILGKLHDFFDKVEDWTGIDIRKLSPLSIVNTIIRNFSPDRISKIIYYMLLFAGMGAAFASATIEYQTMTGVFGKETDISNLPVRVFSVLKKVIMGEPIHKVQTPETHSWLPLIIIFSVEVAKCTLIYKYHNREEKTRQYFRTSVRGLLIILSFCCTSIFLAQLMNKPNEDEINAKIATATTTNKNTLEKNLLPESTQDATLKELYSELEKEKENRTKRQADLENTQNDLDAEITEGRYGRDSGRGTVARGIEESLIPMRRNNLNEIEEKIDAINNEIKRQADKIKRQATTDLNKEIEEIRKGGRALDPKWMSALLSAGHEFCYPHQNGNYTRRWAIVFMVFLNLLMSAALECIIIEAFKTIGEESISGSMA